IRHFLKHQRRNESIALGRRLLNKALLSFDTSLEQTSEEIIQRQLSVFELEHLDELLEDIGLGNRMAYIVAKMLVEPGSLMEDKSQLDLSNTDKPLSIRGSEGMVISFGKCCYPIPGDSVVGHVSSGRGIVIHTDTCPNVGEIRHNPEKILEVEWDKEVSGEFTVELHVELEHHRGMIASLATTITEVEGNIEKISMEEQDSRCCIVQLLLNVRDRVHLARIIKRLRVIKGVHSITRRRES
ncbi:MAG: ACT domain-containing protein, partial [Endozoicomonas sp.]